MTRCDVVRALREVALREFARAGRDLDARAGREDRDGQSIGCHAAVFPRIVATALWLWMLSWLVTRTTYSRTRGSCRRATTTSRAMSSTKAGFSYAVIVT